MTLTVGPNTGLIVDGDAREQHYLDLMRQWRGLDGLIQCHVKDKDLNAPPGSPANGDMYIVGPSPTGAWSAHAGELARYYSVGVGSPGWEFYTPKAGWEARVEDETDAGVPVKYVYSGSTWVLQTGGGGGGGTGIVESIVAGDGIDVDNTDPANPVVSVTGGKETISLPTEFQSVNFDIPINVYRIGGKYLTDFDPRTHRTVRTTKYYVDPVLGVDTNDGLTMTTAFKSVKKAISMGGDIEIECFPGKYYYVDGPQGEVPNAGFNMVCTQGIAEFSNEALPRLWTEHPDYPGMFTTPSVVLGEDWYAERNNLRFFIRAERGSAQYTSGGRRIPAHTASDVLIKGGAIAVNIAEEVTTIRLPNNVDPNAHKEFVVMYATPNIVVDFNGAPATHNVYMENLRFGYGAPYSAIFRNDRADCSIVLVNCESGGGHSDDGIGFYCNGTIINWGGKVEGSYIDGFNYHVAPASGLTNLHILEVDCQSRWNGKDPGGTNNGSTIHEQLKILRLNCDHSYNQDRNVHDVGNSYSLNIALKSRGGQDYTQPNVMFGRDGQSDTTVGWMIGCDVGAIKVATNATLYLDSTTCYGGLVDDGTVINYEV